MSGCVDCGSRRRGLWVLEADTDLRAFCLICLVKRFPSLRAMIRKVLEEKGLLCGIVKQRDNNAVDEG